MEYKQENGRWWEEEERERKGGQERGEKVREGQRE